MKTIITSIILFLLVSSVFNQDTYPTLVVDRIKDLQIQDISVYTTATDNVFEIVQNEQANAKTITYLTNKFIRNSFLNTLPTETFTMYTNSLVYFTTDSKGKLVIALMQDFYIPIEEEEGAILNPDRRLLKIPLIPSSPEKYSIGAVGKYLYNEKLINVKTEGKIIALTNSDPAIPTRLIYYGNYNPLNDKSSGGSSGGDPEEQTTSTPIRIEGYLVDDLDEENKDNQRVQFLGPIGNFMAYIKCGLTQCDAYYSEVLVGQLYVGYLFTLNDQSSILDFCPQELVASSTSNLLFIKSKCLGKDQVNFFYTSFGYRARVIETLTDIPEDIKDEKDITFRLYDYSNYTFNLNLFYSIEAKKFYMKYTDSLTSEYVDLQLVDKLEIGSEIIQLDYLSGSELITIVYYIPSLKQVKARGFTVWADANFSTIGTSLRGQIILQENVDTLQDASSFQFVSPTLKFTDVAVSEVQSYAYVPTNVANNKKTLNYFVSWSKSVFVINMLNLDQETFFTNSNREIVEYSDSQFMLKFSTSPQNDFTQIVDKDVVQRVLNINTNYDLMASKKLDSVLKEQTNDQKSVIEVGTHSIHKLLKLKPDNRIPSISQEIKQTIAST